MLKHIERLHPAVVGLKQSLLLTLYIFLVGNVMVNGGTWFEDSDFTPILAPLLMLTLFIFSALVSASIVLGYPFYTFWVKKDLARAARILGFTAMWLFIFILIYLSTLIYLS